MGTTSRVLLGLIFGAMMSVDMGGPVNKAAYVIGTGALATGEYGIMAAVAGIVSSLAIALCTTFFLAASRLNVNLVSKLHHGPFLHREGRSVYVS